MSVIGTSGAEIKPWRAYRTTTRAVVGVLLSVVLVCAGTVAAPSSAPAALNAGDRVGGLPAAQASQVASDFPDLSMKAGTLVASDGQVLWSRAPSERRAIASITKIMTALVVLDRLSLEDTATVPKQAVAVGESDSKLKAGEVLSVSDLLKALLVKSGNDAAATLALRVAGSEEAFAKLMNDKASELGLSNTQFANAHGLDEEGHFSSAEDLAVVARYAMTNPTFREMVALPEVKIGEGKSARVLESSNQLLGSYPGATGVKTGWTSDAGYSVIASALRDGTELTAVVLGTGSESIRFAEARRLLDWGFAHYRPQRIASKGTPAGEVAVTDFIDVAVPVSASRDETAVIFDVEGPLTRTTRLVEGVRAPVKRGQRLGSVAIRQGGRLVATVPVIAADNVGEPGALERASIAVRRLWLGLIGKPTVAKTAAVS